MNPKKLKLKLKLIFGISAILLALVLIFNLPAIKNKLSGSSTKITNNEKDPADSPEPEESINQPSEDANYYYVSPKGSDSNGGTLEKPFKTINKGIATLEAGDVLCLRAGTYNEKIILTKSGTKDNLIIIQNYKDEKVIIDGKGSSGAGVSIKDKSYIRIEGLEICNFASGDTPMGIHIDGSGEQIELIKNMVYNITSKENAHAIAVFGRNGTTPISNLLIMGNTVYNCKLGQSEAVVVNGNVENFKILNNIVHDNDNIGIDCIGFEGKAPQNDQARKGLIKGNTVYNISSKNNKTYDDLCADGIYVDGGKDLVIERNKVYNCDIGIEVASERLNKVTDNVEVRNNLVYKCKTGLTFGGSGSDNGYADKCSFLNNTLYGNKVGFSIQKSRTNIIKNNIIYSDDLVSDDDNGGVGSNEFSYNIWYSPKDDKEYPGANSKYQDPKFKDPDNSDFTLIESSPAIDFGDPKDKDLSYRTLDGKTRILSKRIDCGTYEYRKK